jgi:hypothetical protein
MYNVVLLRLVALSLLLVFPSHSPLHAQGTPSVSVGWYNGDRLFGVGGESNWYSSDTDFARVYDDFIVPDGGWTVAGVFSNQVFDGNPVITEAAWEIRSGVVSGTAGTLVAWGIGPATQTYNPANATSRIEVDGLQVQLAPGKYWLNVAPVGEGKGIFYVAPTAGANAVGNPPGNDGGAFFNSPSVYNDNFTPLAVAGPTVQTGDFSQGVIIWGNAPPPQQLSAAAQWQADIASLV